MQRTNYLKTTIALAIAGLIVFTAFKIDSSNRETTREQRILQHVKLSLNCYWYLDKGDNISDKTASNPSPKDSPSLFKDYECKTLDGSAENISKDSRITPNDVVMELLRDIKKLLREEKATNKDAESETSNGALVDKLNELLLLPYPRWFPEFSMTVYDSLTLSGDFYLIPSDTLRAELTRLKLTQEQFRLLESIYIRTVEIELRPIYEIYKSNCKSIHTSNNNKTIDVETNVIQTNTNCNALLTDNLVKKVNKLANLLDRMLTLRKDAQQIRHTAVNDEIKQSKEEK